MGLLERFLGPPSRDRFARMVMDGIREAGETRPIRYDPEQFRLSPEGEDEVIYFLHNAYQEYCAASKESRPELLKRVVRTWFASRKEMPETFEDAQPDVLPTVRARAYYELTSLQLKVQGAKEVDWPYQVLADHLAVGLVYDLPEAMQCLPQSALDRWGVSFYQALEAARQNLQEKGEVAIAAIDQRVYISATGDCYDASRLLLPDLIREMKVQGDPIAMIPNRDNLVVTGSDDPKGLELAADWAETALKQPRPITGMAFRLVGDEWSVWLPERGHPQHARFRKLYLQSLGQDYAEQKELLDKLHEKTGEDLFVASFSAIERGDELLSYAVWSKDVAALLPRTDKIALLRSTGDQPALVDWERAAAIAGDLMEPVDLYPERFRVRDFPDDAQWARLVQ